jgi:hypothetical protein
MHNEVWEVIEKITMSGADWIRATDEFLILLAYFYSTLGAAISSFANQPLAIGLFVIEFIWIII